MADTTKPISFRADAETITRLDAIAANFGSKQEMLAALINAWETQGAKTLLPPSISGRLEELGAHMDSINSIVLDLANAYHTANMTARNQFSAQLATKDNTILDLQRQVAELKAVAQTAQQDAQAAVQEAEHKAQLAIQAAEQRAAEQIAQAQAKLATANGELLEQFKQIIAANSTGTGTGATAEQPTESPTPKKPKTTKNAERKAVTAKAP